MLLRPGNCIGCALCRTGHNLADLQEKLLHGRSGQGGGDLDHFVSYREACYALGILLHPVMEQPERLQGKWLLHLPSNGQPHCVAVEFDEDQATVFEGDRRFCMSQTTFNSLLLDATDRAGIIFFTQNETAASVPLPIGETSLLDLRAGSASGAALDQGSIISSGTLAEDRGDVEGALIEHLEHEVDAMTRCVERLNRRGLSPGSSGHVGSVPCPLCPFRRFRTDDTTKRRLLAHLRRYHRQDSPYGAFVASGHRQFSIIRLLFNHSQISSAVPHPLLSTSARVLREVAGQDVLSRMWLDCDSLIKFVLDGTGPVLVRVDDHRMQSVRRFSGKLLYTNDFALLFWRHAMMNWARLRETRRSLVCHGLQAGNRWADALPKNCRTWELLLEDIMGSGVIRRLYRDALKECFDRQEYEHISMDCTVRVLRSIRGQADYRRPMAQRESAPRPDAQSLRRVLSILGRTGAPVLVTCLRTEDAASIAAALGEELLPEARAQVRYVSSDAPSGVMYTALAAVLPNMTVLATDPVHVVINAEMGYGRRRTRCSRALRLIMNKFNKACAVQMC